jgi:hypothetical protein
MSFSVNLKRMRNAFLVAVASRNGYRFSYFSEERPPSRAKIINVNVILRPLLKISSALFYCSRVLQYKRRGDEKRNLRRCRNVPPHSYWTALLHTRWRSLILLLV